MSRNIPSQLSVGYDDVPIAVPGIWANLRITGYVCEVLAWNTDPFHVPVSCSGSWPLPGVNGSVDTEDEL